MSSGQDSAVKAPSLLLALMCRPFKPAQQMLEIELAVRFLESVLPEKKKKKEKKLFNCHFIPLYLIFEKRHLGFPGKFIRRIVCFEREGDGENFY